jgi:hypothetical protein
MACLLSESDAEREVADAGLAGVLVIGVLLHAAAAISAVSPHAMAAPTAIVDICGLTAEASSSGIAGERSLGGVAAIDR